MSDAKPPLAGRTGSADDYNPVASLQEEVNRFKATNRFSPMLVTHFYIQAACVLDYVRHLEETVDRLIRCGDYVCAHRFGERDPVGTRIIAVADLAGAVRSAKRAKWWQNAQGSATREDGR